MIDLNFLLPFIIGGLFGCTAVGGYHISRIAELNRERDRLYKILNSVNDDTELLDWLLDHAAMHYESFDLDDRESIRWAMNAMDGEPFGGDPTTENREAGV